MSFVEKNKQHIETEGEEFNKHRKNISRTPPDKLLIRTTDKIYLELRALFPNNVGDFNWLYLYLLVIVDVSSCPLLLIGMYVIVVSPPLSSSFIILVILHCTCVKGQAYIHTY